MAAKTKGKSKSGNNNARALTETVRGTQSDNNVQANRQRKGYLSLRRPPEGAEKDRYKLRKRRRTTREDGC